jgi:hypothetical protein
LRPVVGKMVPYLDRCYDFKNVFAWIFGKNKGVFCSNYC